MAVMHVCTGCGEAKKIYITVVTMLTTLGGRKARKQTSTPSSKWCRACFDSPKLARSHVTLMREAAKKASSEARAAEWDK